jgi:hypothetical protein
MNKSMKFLAVIIVSCFFIIAGCNQPGSSDNPVPPGPTANPTAAPTAVPVGPAAVNLSSAAFFAILTESGITTDSTIPLTSITGNIGVSPISYAAITGFSLSPTVPVANTTFATSPRLSSGLVYAADYTGAGGLTPTMLTAAIGAKNLAHTDAMGRTPIVANTNLGTAGDIGGLTFAPGLYTWTTNVSIPTNITLSGNVNDTWIFQITGTLTMASDVQVILTGGAQAQNITWATTGTVALGTTAHLEGVVLSATAITLTAGASVNGRLLAGTNVSLISNTITQP